MHSGQDLGSTEDTRVASNITLRYFVNLQVLCNSPGITERLIGLLFAHTIHPEVGETGSAMWVE